ncbi:glycerophosphodiester phosphodiesterase family protein [Paenibacillus thailandensis]|uniref:Glycerophosphodiester phosphodiesterase family protein n=1 Tax=Paenibacillus thailandensis TaxID=393250 RepID=A0ABW5QZE3_9BACL
MKKAKKRLVYKIAAALAVFVAFVYLNNSSLLSAKRDGGPFLLAHRGVAQTFDLEGVENDTCTAERIHEPEHEYLENTIPSMEAAFRAGADMVELDVKPTKDGQFAVFHDWTLDCRTNVSGTAADYTMAELKNVDIGYGYTADGGKTYPFRGKGVGMMPSLTEVLGRFPEGTFLIHIKSNNAEEGEQLAAALSKLSPERQSRLAVYGGDEPISALKDELPHMRAMSMATMKSCLIPYIALGWSGYMPSACKHTELHIPEKIAPFLWGWPNRFLNRMEQADTLAILVTGDGSGFSGGFDTPEDLERLPSGYTGGIWTNRIERIAPAVRE